MKMNGKSGVFKWIAHLVKNKQSLEEKLSHKTREELYKEIFNVAPPKLPKQIELFIKVNGKFGQEITIEFSEDRTEFFLPADPVIPIFTEILDSLVLIKVLASIDSLHRFSQRYLDEIGLKTNFNSQTYLLTIYLNIQANQRFSYYQKNASDSDLAAYSRWIEATNKNYLQPFYTNLDGALNIKNVVLEGGAVCQQGGESIIQRSETRLVCDLPKKVLRITAGDIRYSTFGYQTHIPIGGVGVSKDFSLQPYMLTYPVSKYEFHLTVPADVEIWVNDAMINRLSLEAGTHDLRGFPFLSGSNNVKIVTTDQAGRSDTTQFSFQHETLLLEKNTTQYTGNIGFPSKIIGGNLQYDKSDLFTYVAYRRGITKTLTLDAYSQAFSDKGIFGLGGLYSHPLGILRFEAAGSAIKDVGAGFASKLEFTTMRWASAGDKNSGAVKRLSSPIRWSTRVEYLSLNFPTLSADTEKFFLDKLNFSSEIFAPITESFNVNAGLRYSLRRDTTNLFQLNFGFYKTWIKRLRTSAAFNYSIGGDTRKANPSLLATLQWGFQDNGHFVNLDQRIKRRGPGENTYFTVDSSAPTGGWGFNADLQWNYLNPEPRPGHLFASAAARLAPEYNNYNADVGYEGNQGSVKLSQNIDNPVSSGSLYLQHQTNLNLKTAIVYVGKTIGFSRPIYNGFLVVRGAKNLMGTLLNSDGSPLSHQAISIVPGDSLNSEPIKTFTNSEGRFQCLGRASMTYGINITDIPSSNPIYITIPKDAIDFYRVNELRLTTGTK
jgi:outer membrane usher protein FimD/PapC